MMDVASPRGENRPVQTSRKRPRLVLVLSLLAAPACIEIEPIEPSPLTHYAPTSSSDTDVAGTIGTSDTGAPLTGATAADDTSTTAVPPPPITTGNDGPCTAGSEGCPCTPGGSCDPGLSCLSGYCVDVGCPIGSEGCACTKGGGCDPGLECLSMLCVDPDG